MRIGELARRAGVNTQTVRFYERQKLLRQPSRTLSGYRLYREADLERVIFIKQAQQLGFTLREIGELIEIHDPGNPPSQRDARDAAWERAIGLAEERLRQIDDKIRFLENFRAQLAAILKNGYSRFCAPPAQVMARKAPPRQRKTIACPTAENVHKRDKKPL